MIKSIKIFTILVLTLLCIWNITIAQSNQDGYRIDITLEGWEEKEAFLGYHVGSKTYVEDTAAVKNGRVIFEGNYNLTPGMYFLYAPNGTFMEFLISDQRRFSLYTKHDDLTRSMKVTGSLDNELFFNYQKRLSNYRQEAEKYSEQYKNSTGRDSIQAAEKLTEINNAVTDFQRSELIGNTGTFYSQVLSQIVRPKVVEAPENYSEERKKDYQYRIYKSRFWEGTDFNNPGTVKTPMFEPKLNEYFDKLVYKQVDSISLDIDKMLSVEMDTAVYRYIVVTLTNKYAASKMMGMDAVYVHMIDNYYSTGKAYWVDDATLTRMEQTSERLKPLLLGQVAPVFRAENLQGETVMNALTVTDKDYKILFFYDSDCGHCKKAIPKLMTAFEELKNQNVSAEVITMNLGEDREEWTNFLTIYNVTGKKLSNLKGVSNAGYYYYVDSTPQIYILDKDNKIIAKKLSAEYVDDFIIDYIKANE